MKIKISIIINLLLIIAIVSNCKDNKSIESIHNEKINIKNNEILILSKKCESINNWKYGFGFNDQDIPLCYDPEINIKSDFVITYFIKTDDEVKKTNEEIVHGDSIRIYDDMILVLDAYKKNRGLPYGEGQELKHKIENCRNYISKDGRNWEVLEIKYFKETNEKMVYTQTNVKNDVYTEPLILVYFKCSYFEGEYYITSRL